jgi:hypothetical protein
MHLVNELENECNKLVFVHCNAVTILIGIVIKSVISEHVKM